MTRPQSPEPPRFGAEHQPDERRDEHFLATFFDQLSTRQRPPSFGRQLTVSFQTEPPSKSYQFALHCEREDVPLLRDLADWAFKDMAVEQAVAEDFLMILEECLSNVVRHSYQDEDQKTMVWQLALTPDEILFRLEDYGINGRSDVVNQKLDSIPETGRPPLRRGGMGLFLIKRMMDEVTYTPGREDQPNCLQLRKFLTPRSDSDE